MKPSVSRWSPVAFWKDLGAAGRAIRPVAATLPVKARSFWILRRSSSMSLPTEWANVLASREKTMSMSWVAAPTQTG
jgi:hypothetical protein